jgi:hypothetical protein
MVISSALGIAGCTSQSAVEGPPCDEAAIQNALKSGADGSDESVFSIDDITCADGWAVAFPTVGVAEDVAVTITAVFRAEGQSWVEVDRSADGVCGTDNPNEDPMNPVYPDDAQVPESLWRDACRTN